MDSSWVNVQRRDRINKRAWFRIDVFERLSRLSTIISVPGSRTRSYYSNNSVVRDKRERLRAECDPIAGKRFRGRDRIRGTGKFEKGGDRAEKIGELSLERAQLHRLVVFRVRLYPASRSFVDTLPPVRPFIRESLPFGAASESLCNSIAIDELRLVIGFARNSAFVRDAFSEMLPRYPLRG